MLAKFGSIVVAGSGKIGGHVASKNRSGAYFRTKVTPVNPQSVHQQNVRSLFAEASQAWLAISDSQRVSWNNASQLQARTNIFGDQVLLSGKALFASQYINLKLIGGTPLTSPVTPISTFAFTTFSAAADNSSQSLIVTFSSAIPATHNVLLFATPSLSAGVSFVKNQFRKLGSYGSSDVSPLTVSTSYLARFGPVGDVGMKIHLYAISVEIASGRAYLAGSCVATIVS